MQRLLSSHPDVLIWGEHEAQLAPLVGILAVLRQRERSVGLVTREAYARLRHQAFMANLMPEAASIERAGRAFVEELFARPALAHGRARWGFKETSYRRADAEALRTLFPGLRVVHITRDPRDVLVSLDEWERTAPGWSRGATLRALGDWAAVNESFADPPPWVSSHRYEDAVSEPEEFTRGLAGFVGIDHERIDRVVFEVRAHGTGYEDRGPRDLRAFDELPEELRLLLDDEGIRPLTERHGYAPRASQSRT